MNTKGEWIYILIKINEGPRFKMGQVDLAGDFGEPKATLLQDHQCIGTGVFRRDAIRQDVLAMTDVYADKGYAHADMFPGSPPTPITTSVDTSLYHQKLIRSFLKESISAAIPKPGTR
ncbi:MAG: hypothetical protein R2861_08475 [Desulfobacterales bacterium]